MPGSTLVLGILDLLSWYRVLDIIDLQIMPPPVKTDTRKEEEARTLPAEDLMDCRKIRPDSYLLLKTFNTRIEREFNNYPFCSRANKV